ncbi:MAG: ATP-binding protein, partial [Pseudomonadota bacterium]
MSQHELPATVAQAPNAPEARSVGHVIECDGSEAQIHALSGRDGQTRDYWAVGQLISIEVGDKRLVGLLHRVQTGPQGWVDGEANHMTLSVELAGEVRPSDTGGHYFSSGISAYPFLGAKAHRIQKEDLVTIYKSGDQVAIPVGVLSQARDIPAIVSVDALLSRHFAVVGTTGTGKSTAVSMILHMIAEKKQDQRILILDPHNEYSSAFGEKAHTITADSLDMPFWLLNLEEFAQVVFRGRESTDEEVDILREFIPKAKMLYRDGAVGKVLRKGGGGDGNAITADSPLPYRIADLIALLDEEIGSLDGAI